MVTIDGLGGTYKSSAAAIRHANAHNNRVDVMNFVDTIRSASGRVLYRIESVRGGYDYRDEYDEYLEHDDWVEQ